jgi:pyrroloquinoline quinone (PQQ) biosynthesis protein C
MQQKCIVTHLLLWLVAVDELHPLLFRKENNLMGSSLVDKGATSQIHNVPSINEETDRKVVASLHVHYVWDNHHVGTTLSDESAMVYLTEEEEEEAESLKQILRTCVLLMTFQ